ncbi:MAG: T9SS type A sorting domain-containing protein [Bacteroidota bacterium]
MRNLRNTFAVIVFLTIQVNLKAQQWIWASQVGKDFASDSFEPQVRTNDAGDLFTSGTFQNFAKIGDTIFYIDSSFYLYRGNYVARLNNANQLIWTQFIGGQNTALADLSIDLNNNTYVVGIFANDLILDDTTLTNGGDYESFIAAFDPLGHRKWLKRYPTIISNIVNDENNNLIYAYSTPFSTVPILGIGKISASGNEIWSKTYSSSAATIKGLKNDSNNNIYLAATFDGNEFKIGTTFYYEGTDYPSSSGLIKINATGVIQNVEIIRGASIRDFGLDSQDNIYALGTYDKSMKIRQFSFDVPETCLPPTNCEEFFIAKLNTEGTASWARKKKPEEPLVLKALTVSENGNFYIAGAFRETLAFDGVTITEQQTRSAVFIYKFNTSGIAQWAQKNSGGNQTDCFAYDVACSENKSIYLSGNFHNFNNNCWFGNDTLPKTGIYTHIFLAKMTDSQVECIPPPAPSTSNKTICSGKSTTLSASGVGILGWYSAESAGTYLGGGANYTTPVLTVNKTYYVQDSTCAPSLTRKAVLVTVNPLPVVNANSSASTVCAGTTVVLTGEGASTYSWTGGVMNGVGFIPTSTTTYTVTGTDANNCSNTRTKTINVNALPVVTANANTSTVCAGTMVTLTGGGASTYSWTGGVIDGIGFVPSSTTTYTVTGTDANNCSNTATKNINVNPLPIVTANASATMVCAGTTVTLAGGGASTYSWTGGVIDGIGFVSSSTTTYTVTGTDANNCSNTATNTINVNPLPIVTANASITAVCAGTTVTLTGGGASTYSWTGGVIDGIGFVPSSTTTYTVTGTDVNNCSNTATTTINVDPLPDVTTILNETTISANQSGAVYQWLDCNNGLSPISGATNQSYTATVNGNYAVIVSMNTCSDTSTCVNVNITGISEIPNNNNQLIIFPNPGNGSLTIQSTSDGVYTIMNESGQQIQLFELNSGNKFTINIEDLSTGIYFIVGFNNNNQMMRQKVVVTK